jgi:hypothetical protein
MKASSLSLAIAVFALSSGAAFADGTSSNLTRADVAQSVLAARAAGQLRPAGEADRNWLVDTSTASAVSRDEVKQGVVAARAAGQQQLRAVTRRREGRNAARPRRRQPARCRRGL